MAYHHSTPTQVKPSHTQLHFTHYKQPAFSNGLVKKPKPIVIEKLLPYPQAHVTPLADANGTHSSMPSNSVLCSDRLAAAMQLAKLDIRKLKGLLKEKEDDQIRDSKYERKAPISFKEDRIEKKAGRSKKPAKKPENKSYELCFYPDVVENEEKRRKAPVDKQIEGEKVKNVDNIEHLQKDLEKHTKMLQNVVKTLDSRRQPKVKSTDDEALQERERKQHHADEQVRRSGRMLYMLQRKVQDLNRQINQKTYHVRQTKKSEYMQSVASAHRAAVRTLQIFVKHAPLYYDTSGRLPSIYQELGSLIQQLTSLSFNEYGNVVDRSVVEDLVTSLNEVLEKPEKKEPIKKKEKIKQPTLEDYEEWMRLKAEKMKIGLPKENKKPAKIGQVSKMLRPNEMAIGHQRNVIYKSPKQRQKQTKLKVKSIKFKPSAYPNLHNRPSTYAAPTVASRIREKPPVEKVTTPKKNVAFQGDHRSLKDRDEEIVEEARHRSIYEDAAQRLKSPHYSPRSPSPSELNDSNIFYNEPKYSPRRSLAFGSSPPFAEKEIKRQHWLDRWKQYEMRKLDRLGKKNAHQFLQLRKDFEASKHLITQAEKDISQRLKPLLDRAESIAKEDEERTKDYERSVKKRLADVASQKALSEGERLAEYILEDLIREAAVDLSKIDQEKRAEVEAAFLFDRPTLESIEERLSEFQKEEDVIRRKHQTVTFAQSSNKELSRPEELFAFTSSSKPPYQGNRKAYQVLDDRPFIDILNGMFDNIQLHRDRFVQYKKKDECKIGTFQPDKFIESYSEELLDDILSHIAEEWESTCNLVVDEVYEKEFLHHNL